MPYCPAWAGKRHTHTAQGLAISTIHGDLLWLDGGWPGSCHEHELLALAGMDQVLDEVEVPSLLDRGFRGLAKAREHWHAPVGDRRTKDRLTGAQRTFNRLQAGLRALVEQSIAHLAGAWGLRRWRGLNHSARPESPSGHRPPERRSPIRCADHAAWPRNILRGLARLAPLAALTGTNIVVQIGKEVAR